MDKREYMIKKDSVGKSKKTVAGLLMIAFILLLSSMTTQAASVKWKSLYRNFLARNERSYPYFTVLNIDNKGTPELIVAQDVTCYWYNLQTSSMDQQYDITKSKKEFVDSGLEPEV